MRVEKYICLIGPYIYYDKYIFQHYIMIREWKKNGVLEIVQCQVQLESVNRQK